MARKRQMDHCDAKELLRKQGIDFRKDFFVLPASDVGLIVDAARATGYRKRRDAPGSRGRMYYQFLQRSCRETLGQQATRCIRRDRGRCTAWRVNGHVVEIK